jgi:hypothetical protein
VINNNVAYVAAEDSIVMYNIDTYQRVAAIADSGLCKLYYNSGKLIVTKQYPIKRFFVEILDASNLALLGFVQGISGDCAGAVMTNNMLYVAVDSGYQGTRGRLAIIDPAANWQLLQEVDFGTQAVGIFELYNYNNQIVSVNKTPYGGLDAGSLTFFDPGNSTFQNHLYNVRVGDGYGIRNNLLYLNINGGIGSISLDTYQIGDTTIIPAPSSTGTIVIHSAAIDYINDQFYLNIGNYSSFGIGIIASLAGDSLGTYATGINPEGIAIDYRTPNGISPKSNGVTNLTVTPNPVSDVLTITFTGDETVGEIRIFDITGRNVLTRTVNESMKNVRISCKDFPSGIYMLSASAGKEIFSRKFIKK